MSWLLAKKEWILSNRKYLCNDNLKGVFIRHYDEKLKKYYFEYLPSDYDIILVKSISEEKAIHTNDENQDGIKRNINEKINKQFEGCLAELVAAKFLIQIFSESPENIDVYDYNRKNFQYTPEEYDIAIVKGTKKIRCEIRNSWSYKTSITDFCEKCDVIGKYTNEIKQQEELADFFIRPVLQLVSLDYSIPKNTEELILNKKAKIYIVAACTKEEMIEKGSYNNFLSKHGTKFWTVKIEKLKSVEKYEDEYNKLFE